jgi:hypothetical protein
MLQRLELVMIDWLVSDQLLTRCACSRNSKHDATTAVEGFDCRRHRKLAAHGGNLSIAN